MKPRKMYVICPLCDTQIPVYYSLHPGRLVFTKMAWADLRAHLWAHEAGGGA